MKEHYFQETETITGMLAYIATYRQPEQQQLLFLDYSAEENSAAYQAEFITYPRFLSLSKWVNKNNKQYTQTLITILFSVEYVFSLGFNFVFLLFIVCVLFV